MSVSKVGDRVGEEGEPEFEAVMKEFGASLFRMAASYAPPGAAREDLEQEIALAIFEALPRFRQDSSLRTYVFKVANNRCIDLLRRGKLPLVDEPKEQSDSAPSPEQVVSARIDLERVAAALRTVPIAQRQSLLLALEGLTHAEIAEAMGVSESAISVRIHRARHTLSEALNTETDP